MKYKEGSLNTPIRHAIDWKNQEFYDEAALENELERVFDICHGCRRCVSLCNAFPTLFDLIDESETMEVDGVSKQDYSKVVHNCYLCDLCYMTKCPYVPPHEWNVDFPHLMLRAKAALHVKGNTKTRDTVLTSTDQVGKFFGIPIVAQISNKASSQKWVRKLLEKFFGIHHLAVLPKYTSRSARHQFNNYVTPHRKANSDENTTGKVAVFTTCYGNYNDPSLVKDLIKILEHNGIVVKIVEKEVCCGMPKLELGDLQSVDDLKTQNMHQLAQLVKEGWDVVAPIPSCVLMFKQELPLMNPKDKELSIVAKHIFDPFEYLALRNKSGNLKTDFKNTLGKISYHAACHLRVQNMGLKTRDILSLVPQTELQVIERCSGHNGTYAVKEEFHDISMKICKPVSDKIDAFNPDHYTSDCPMAGQQIKSNLKGSGSPQHPLTLLCFAYGL
ncbi:MAG: heterodisulfide reductase-related iron-sulfur binding cluster [Pseudomonadota bacterium]